MGRKERFFSSGKSEILLGGVTLIFKNENFPPHFVM